MDHCLRLNFIFQKILSLYARSYPRHAIEIPYGNFFHREELRLVTSAPSALIVGRSARPLAFTKQQCLTNQTATHRLSSRTSRFLVFKEHCYAIPTRVLVSYIRPYESPTIGASVIKMIFLHECWRMNSCQSEGFILRRRKGLVVTADTIHVIKTRQKAFLMSA